MMFSTELNNSRQIQVGRTWGKRLHFQNSSEANKVVIEEREKKALSTSIKKQKQMSWWSFKLIFCSY